MYRILLHLLVLRGLNREGVFPEHWACAELAPVDATQRTIPVHMTLRFNSYCVRSVDVHASRALSMAVYPSLLPVLASVSLEDHLQNLHIGKLEKIHLIVVTLYWCALQRDTE